MDPVGVVMRDGQQRTGGSIGADGSTLVFDGGDHRQVMDVTTLHRRPVRGMLGYLIASTILILLISYRFLDVSLAFVLAGAAVIFYYGTWIAMGRSTWDAIARGMVDGRETTWRMQGLTRHDQRRLGQLVREMRRD